MPWCVRVARVLVGQHAGVDVEARQLLVERRLLVERVGERRRPTTSACPGTGEGGHLGGELVLRRAPRRVGRIDVGEVPFVLVGNLGAVALLREADQRDPEQRDGREDQVQGRS